MAEKQMRLPVEQLPCRATWVQVLPAAQLNMVHKFHHSFTTKVDTNHFKTWLENTATQNNVKVVSFKETDLDPEGKNHLEFDLDGEDPNIEKVAHEMTHHYQEAQNGQPNS